MRLALFVIAGLAFIAGCASNAGNPALPSTGAALETQVSPQSRGPLLYAGGPDANAVDAYRAFAANPLPSREITKGLDAPTGMAVDASGNLYVCNNAGQSVPGQGAYWTVTVYHHGRGKPFKAYTDGVFSPVDVAVATDGTVYIANLSSAVTVYAPGSLKAGKTLAGPSGYAPLGVALDAKNNVYVSYIQLAGSGGHIYRYKAGETKGRDLGISFSAEPHGLAIDHKGNLIVAVSAAPNQGSDIEVFAPGGTHPKKTFTGPFQPFMVTLSADEIYLYVADYGSGNNDGAVFAYSYKTGGLLFKDTRGTAAGAYGVALSP